MSSQTERSKTRMLTPMRGELRPAGDQWVMQPQTPQ